MKKFLLPALLLMAGIPASAQYSHTVNADNLDRGLLAVKTDNGVFVSWRSLANDDKALVFDVYRDGVKVNDAPLKKGTNFTDPNGTAGSKYTVKAILNNQVTETSKEVTAWDTFYKKIHLDRPAGGIVPPGAAKDKNGNSYEQREYTYTPDDVSVADVDGDGEFEYIVKWFPTNAADNSHQRFTGNTLIDCYKLDGTKLWRIDLGINIRSGNHYTQFMAYDFNGDGKAEVICKTAPGTKDSKGKAVILGNDNPDKDYRNSVGTPLSGPEYLTVFNGETGEEIHTIAYNPPRSIRKFDKTSTGWGDNYGGRSERYLAGVAYLGNGNNASAVFVRGYYTASYVWAVDFDGKQLKERWLHKSETKGKGIYGEGSHSLTIGDVDADGYDEIIIGAGAVDHDGKLLHRTGAGHGDALHLTDMLPDREGLEIFMPHEDTKNKYATTFRDARTGEIIFSQPMNGKDNGRGLAANVSAKHRGYEYWSSYNGNVMNNGVAVGSKRPSVNFRIYWDGDLLDELLDGTTISKPNDALTGISTLMAFGKYSNATSCNTTKATPNLQADLFGDWREEVILHDKSTESDLIIFTTTIPTDYRVTCLMQDRQYREAVAWQNVAYNQPPHLSYNLEESFNTNAKIVVNSGNLSQLVLLGDEIQPIEFTIARATGVKADNLPAGINFTFDNNSLTGKISGKPAEVGEYSFTVSTTGAEEDNNTSITVTLNVRQDTSVERIAYYPFETVGETTPDILNSENATAVGGNGTLVEGKKGNALQLNGKNHYAQKHHDAINVADRPFTIEFWMNSTDDAAYMIHKGAIASANGGNWFGIEYKNGELRFAVDDDKTKSETKWGDGKSIFDGNWHHVAAVRDFYGKELRLYVDGQLKSNDPDNTGAINAVGQDLVIGNVGFSFDNNYTGMFDDLSIYKGVLSATKIKEHFETTAEQYIAHFTFDEIGESVANNVFGNATMNGSVGSTVGVKGGAAEFDGSAYLTQPVYDALQVGNGDFSVELWMNSKDDDGYLFCIGTHNTTNVEGGTGNWIGLEKASTRFTFSIDDNKTKSDVNADDMDAAFDGNWHHVVCVRNAAEKTMSLYIDGKLAGTKTGVGTGAINFDPKELFFIGGDDEPTAGKEHRTFNGSIDELAIYPRALSPEEIGINYMMLRPSEISDIIANGGYAQYTVVDAFSGIILKTAVGEGAESVIEGLDKGVYIIVVEEGTSQKAYKFRKM